MHLVLTLAEFFKKKEKKTARQSLSRDRHGELKQKNKKEKETTARAVSTLPLFFVIYQEESSTRRSNVPAGVKYKLAPGDKPMVPLRAPSKWLFITTSRLPMARTASVYPACVLSEALCACLCACA
jgi:hypothetical protein